ncbi:MoaD/ThiS family protein [Vibrio ostreicida]|uniref:MoaD/ThiS family protein n=1 Tax=Vibrio ostreicida TaxID=526588 RepID=A0ABT8BVM2_9VIBR|nr:MoaD/ThiS family protein [Vibrio ostreicida]MDN3610446.1 MoaD/ThiS family protein [Vibrio ostreicida]NPD07550.1 MoaD/ThiS family protein [Vibrio ostreicida]
MTTLTFSTDLTTTPFGVSLEYDIHTVDDLVAIVKKHPNIKVDKIFDTEGHLHHFLTFSIDGKIVPSNELAEGVSSPKEIMVFNAIAGG